jgi:hypothetical protein
VRDPFDNFSTDDTVRSALRKAGVSDIAMYETSALRDALSKEVGPILTVLADVERRLDRLEGR